MTKWDKVLMVSILVLSLAGLTFVSAMGIDGNQKYAIIKENGKIIKKISVSEREKNKIYDFQFGDGYKGYIEINNGAVRMLEMDKNICPERICSDTGWISKKYQTIVCLPNKLSVSLEQKMDEELDVISY